MERRLILGAPGCGKTTRLMGILDNELKQVTPDRIAFVSFTRKGAYEGRERAIEKFGYKIADLPYFKTLHAIAFASGGYSKYDVISKKDYRAFSEALDMKFTGYYTEDFHHNDDRYLFLHFLERNNIEMASLYKDDIDIKIFRNVKYNYAEYKKFAKVIDYTDMLESFIKEDKTLPVDVAIIDEAQDLTSLQWDMCKIAFRDCKRLYIAGDDDQAIYEWNGADVKQFLEQKGEREILDKSYRLQEQILEFSKRISGKIGNRIDKKFDPISNEGMITYHNTLDDITIVKDESYYFLSRNNWFLNIHKKFVMSQAMGFICKDKKSISESIVNSINIFEVWRKTKKITEQERIKILPWLIDNVNLKLPWFNNFKLDNDTLLYYRDIIKNKTNVHKFDITISTIHGVKGGEADHVVLLTDFTKAVRANFEKNPDSELRCLYVACTRAKNHLHIVHSNTKSGYDDFITLR